HEVFLAIAPDGEVEAARQRVDDGNADAVQTARHLVGILVEFAAGMKLGHDHFGGGNPLFPVHGGRDTATVIGDGDRTVGVEIDLNVSRVTGKRLVDRIVDDLIDHVVQAGAVIGIADIHARTLAHGIETLQDLDRLGAVVAGSAGTVVGGDV